MPKLGEMKRRRAARFKQKEFYTDRNGTLRYTDSNEPYMLVSDFDYETLQPGDTWEVDPYTGKKKRNLSEDVRRRREIKQMEEASSKGAEYFAYEGISQRHYADSIKGERYKRIEDVKNGVCTPSIFVRRFACKIPLFINIDTTMAEDWDISWINAMTNNGRGQLSVFHNGLYEWMRVTNESKQKILNWANSEHPWIDNNGCWSAHRWDR